MNSSIFKIGDVVRLKKNYVSLYLIESIDGTNYKLKGLDTNTKQMFHVDHNIDVINSRCIKVSKIEQILERFYGI